MNYQVVIYVAMFLVPGIVLVVKGIFWRIQRYHIEYMRTTPIGKLKNSFVEVKGRAFGTEHLQAPFSRKQCLYYAYVLEEYKRPKSSAAYGEWIVIRKGESFVPFSLQDETGSVPINPKQAIFSLKKHKEYTTEATINMHAHLLEFLKAQGVSLDHHGEARNLRFKEYLIRDGDFVFIVGSTVQKHDDKALSIQKGFQRRFFCITDGDSHDILNEMDWNGVGGIFGGAAAMLVGLLFLFLMTGLHF
jgi:hypothetical protein